MSFDDNLHHDTSAFSPRPAKHPADLTGRGTRDSGELERLLHACRDDFALFNREILGRPPCWTRQLEIADSVARHRDTLVCSGNATGKTWLAAGLILWYLYTRPRSLVVVTGPSQTSLGSVTFKEVRTAWRNAKYEMGGKLSTSVSASPQLLEVCPAAGWYALGVSTTSVERLSGQHNANLFAVVDEASGVDEQIYQAIDSLSYEKMLAIGNPIRADGRFHEMWRQAQRESLEPSVPEHRRVHAIRVASTESPDAHLERSPRGLADASWLDAMRRRYGEHSLWWRTHVLAQFPDVSADSLIAPEWLDRATSLVRTDASFTNPAAGLKRIACDVSEGVGRDRTVILVRDDLGILEVVANRLLGLAETADAIRTLAAVHKVTESFITYDASGIGRDLAVHLARHDIKYARAYHGAGSGHGHFANMRSAAAWALRRRLDPCQEPAFHIPHATWWPEMRDELSALRYEDLGDKTKLENKDKLKVRLGHSPDFADALIQSFSY